MIIINSTFVTIVETHNYFSLPAFAHFIFLFKCPSTFPSILSMISSAQSLLSVIFFLWLSNLRANRTFRTPGRAFFPGRPHAVIATPHLYGHSFRCMETCGGKWGLRWEHISTFTLFTFESLFWLENSIALGPSDFFLKIFPYVLSAHESKVPFNINMCKLQMQATYKILKFLVVKYC